MATNWNLANPADNSKIRDGAGHIRTNNAALDDAIDREHLFPGDQGTTAGIHKFPVVGSDPTAAEGRLAIVNNVMRYYSNGAWRSGSFPSGTAMYFYQAAAPVGWTQVALNDYVVIVTSGAGGGGNGGNWTLSGVSVDSHTLTINEIPSHTHGLSTTTVGGTGGGAVNGGGAAAQTGASGGGLGHNHGLTNNSWRPQGLLTILCSKN